MALRNEAWVLPFRPNWVRRGKIEMVGRVGFVALGLAVGMVTYDVIPDRFVTTQVHGNLKIVHSRFASSGSPETVNLRLATNTGEAVSIQFSKTFAENYELNGITPAPNTVATTANGAVMMFEPKPNSEHIDVALTLTPLTWGRRHLVLTASFAERLSVQTAITQLVVPF